MTTLKLSGVRAFVFDAYGTLFDVNNAAETIKDDLGEQWQAISNLWRSKQLQYTWLRSLAGNYVDFWQVTGEALTYALRCHSMEKQGLHDRLMNLYWTLRPYPEVMQSLGELKARGIRCAILSNGSPKMLSAAVDNAGIATLLDAVISVDSVGVFKPHPSVYRLAPARLGIKVSEICFVSANAWDAYSAKAFGFHVLWCNRAKQQPEIIPATPDAEIDSLAGLPDFLV